MLPHLSGFQQLTLCSQLAGLAQKAGACDNMRMNPVRIIAAKRDGHPLSELQIVELVEQYTQGDIPDYQMAAFAMAVFFQGMTDDETTALTSAMLHSGTTLSWPRNSRPIADKHSTGGIGDKISVALAPALAACGLRVPMISGRGLGATGGTLDKLESIPGFQTNLSTIELQSTVDRVGCVIAGANNEIAPADQKLYALRDVTATVPSIPLITASILSKKLAEGLDALVLDVKWGSGSFMKTVDNARALAKSLVSVAKKMGVKARALLTDMNQPLGRMIGNAVEIDESVQVLQGSGPDDVRELTLLLGAHLLVMSGLNDELEDARTSIDQTIATGSALEKFEQMVSEQGGDLKAKRPRRAARELTADRDGWIQTVDAEQIGWAIIELGGGRRKIDDAIDPSTGVQMLARIGDRIDRGQPIMNVFCTDDQFEQVQAILRKAVNIGDHPISAPALLVETITDK